MKKSLIIACNAWVADEMGGAYRIASEFALHCAHKGYDTHYVSMNNRPSANVEYSLKDGVHLWRYPGPSHSGEGKSAGNLIGHWKGTRNAAAKLKKVIGVNASVTLNGHTALQYWGLLGPLRGMLKRRVLTVHSPLVAEYMAEKGSASLSLREKLAVAALGRIEKKIYRQSDVIHCVSQYTKKYLESNFPSETASRLEVCPGYAEARAGALAISRKDARAKLADDRWMKDATYFFTARRLVPRTGVDTLIRSTAWLKKAGAPAFYVMIAGQGPMAETYQKLANELGVAQEVHFMGSISEERLRIAHRAADCFVLPTRELECFGLVILEAYASGTPVIATPVGAISELMGPSQEGLAGENSPESLGDRMLFFLRRGSGDEAQSRRLAEFAGNYEKTKILNRLEALVMGPEGTR